MLCCAVLGWGGVGCCAVLCCAGVGWGVVWCGGVWWGVVGCGGVWCGVVWCLLLYGVCHAVWCGRGVSSVDVGVRARVRVRSTGSLSLHASLANTQDKLRFLFTVLSSNGDKKLPHRELKRALGAAICKTLHRIRGKGGQWLDRECAGCKRTPSGVVYACFDCCAGYIMGVPITVHLCGDCCKSWEGVLEEKGTDTQHHARHTLTCHGAVPAGGQVYHTGVQCDSCGMLPIVGPRYHCKDCKDMLALCGSCHDEGAEPLAHAASHNCIVITEQQTLEEQVVWLRVQRIACAPFAFQIRAPRGRSAVAHRDLELEEFASNPRQQERAAVLGARVSVTLGPRRGAARNDV